MIWIMPPSARWSDFRRYSLHGVYRISGGSWRVLDGFNLPMEKAAVTFRAGRARVSRRGRHGPSSRAGTPFAGPGSRADAIRADEAQHTTPQLPNDHGGTTTRSSATTSACSSNCLLEVVLTAGSSTRYWPGRNIASRQCSCPLIMAVEASESGFGEKCENPPFPLSGLSLEPGKKRKANHRRPGNARLVHYPDR